MGGSAVPPFSQAQPRHAAAGEKLEEVEHGVMLAERGPAPGIFAGAKAGGNSDDTGNGNRRGLFPY